MLVDTKAWNLLRQSKAFHIEKRDGGFWYLAGTAESGKYSDTVAYVHDPLANSKYRVCAPEHKKIDCGECVVKVDHEWWIYYVWYPDDLGSGQFNQCLREGHIALGYEMPTAAGF